MSDIVKVVEVQVKVGGAVANLNEIKDVIIEQKEITIEFRKELLLLEEQLKNTPKGSLAAQTALKNKIQELKGAIREQGVAVQELTLDKQKAVIQDKNLEQANTNMATSLSRSRSAMTLLNQATGGMAMQFKYAYDSLQVFGGGFGKALTAVKTFSTGAKAALISSGIGILLIAVASLIASWQDMKGLVSGVSGAMKAQGDIAQKNANLEEEKLNTLNGQDNILKLQGKSETEILNIKKKQTADTIKALEIQLIAQEAQKKAQVEASKRNRDILSGVLKFISAPITLLLMAVDKIGEAFGKDFNLTGAFDSIASMVFDPEEVATEGDKTIKETKDKLNSLKNTQAGYENSLNDIRKKASDDAQKIRDANFKKQKEELDKQKKIDEENARKAAETEEARQKAILDIRESYIKKLEDLEDDTQLKKIERQEKRALEELEKLKGTEDEKTELLKYYANLRIANEEEIKAKEFEKELTKKAKDAEDSELSFQERLTLLAERDAMILGNEKLTEEERTKFLKENADARIKIAQLEAKAKSDALQSYGDALGSIADLIGESTVVGKVAAVASAGISTYLSAQKAYESQMLIPSPDAPIRATLAASVAVGAGLKNIKAILSVKTPKGGGGGGSVPSISAPSASAPNFNIVGATGLDNQIATGLGTTKQAPIKAYVVSTEVSSQQSLDRNIKDNATLG